MGPPTETCAGGQLPSETSSSARRAERVCCALAVLWDLSEGVIIAIKRKAAVLSKPRDLIGTPWHLIEVVGRKAKDGEPSRPIPLIQLVELCVGLVGKATL